MSASWDHTLKLWEAATGKLRHTLEGHNESVWHAAWSPDGVKIVSASADGSVRIWANPERLKDLDLHKFIREGWVNIFSQDTPAASPDPADRSEGAEPA